LVTFRQANFASDVEGEDYGVAYLIVIDPLKADRTTRQHGIAWVVNNRLVGNPGWLGFDQERLLDGRSSEQSGSSL
jgi:hypothetical protein